MLESEIERRLKKLEDYGFDVLKLRTPANNGVMDRMILWPTYAPNPPTFIELKRPDAKLRKLQEEVSKKWKQRGCDVQPFCSTLDEVDALIHRLRMKAERQAQSNGNAYSEANDIHL